MSLHHWPSYEYVNPCWARNQTVREVFKCATFRSGYRNLTVSCTVAGLDRITDLPPYQSLINAYALPRRVTRSRYGEVLRTIGDPSMYLGDKMPLVAGKARFVTFGAVTRITVL